MGNPRAINLAVQAVKEFPSPHGEVTKGRQRWVMLVVIIVLFVSLNTAVMWLIYRAIGIDVAFIAVHPDLADRRIITSAVVQTLIGSTVVQTGAVTWAMARYLFPYPHD